VIVGAFGAAAWFAFGEAAIPEDAYGKAQLPAVALGQTFIYRVELLVATVFAGLLLLTPLLQGLLNGRLPTEITARGAKYHPEDVAAGLAEAQKRIDKLEATLASDVGALVAVKADVQALKRAQSATAARPLAKRLLGKN
jgi:hypothetical protein